MIPRYTPPEMAALWSDEARYQRWLDVELAVTDILAEDGIVPTSSARRMRVNAKFDLAAIERYEAVSRHDVIAFTQSVGDSLGADKRWLHLGLTSYDVVDTALALTLVKAGELILGKLAELRSALVEQARQHKLTLMPGRTHGALAEPITLGWVLCGYIAECDRAKERLISAVKEIGVGKLSGAVGTYSAITPDQERRALERLGLKPETIATQIAPRDRHAVVVCRLAITGGLCERLALEIRLLAHSEVEELYEPFKEGQRGSSAMPHKKNPVTAENICGLARLLRSYATASLENEALWHQRDISHSSVERVILPDSTCLLYYMLDKCAWMAREWQVDVERMRRHVKSARGLMQSGALLTALKLAGIDDDDIYVRVQAHALAARNGGASLLARAKDDDAIVKALGDKLEAVFDDEAVLKRVDIAFERVGI
ncbi:MAG: adenylosuccinate lyase [Calditrichaeota bacterium]|nr:adenylosuccinate lyase [Calditrichota bacterium]